jgi:hypothetical protein
MERGGEREKLNSSNWMCYIIVIELPLGMLSTNKLIKCVIGFGRFVRV